MVVHAGGRAAGACGRLAGHQHQPLHARLAAPGGIAVGLTYGLGQAGGGAFGSMQIPKVAGDADSMQALDITVTGDRATVKPPGSSQVAFWLRKEGGEWKFCSTDNPVFKNLPGTR